MQRTYAEWLEICDKITAGYTPGADKRKTFTSSSIHVDRLKYWGCGLGEGVRLFDLGCGNGRLPMGLIYAGFDKIDYMGMDVILPCIEFCQMAFAPWPNFKFEHNNVSNRHYWNTKKNDPLDFDLPIKNNFVDIFWANSLFTHLGSPEITLHYLEEVYRTLKPGAISICTWLSTDDENSAAYEEKKTIFLKLDIENFYSKAGLRITGTQNRFTTPQLEICAVKE